ncbi:MAG: FAD-dependent oxidoreductase, partial [Candidatus Methanomethylophilaceae archaeon]
LNQYLFNMANIRDQCSWIHMHEPAKATEKSKDLVRMAVAKVRLLEPLEGAKIPVTNSAAVIGGGVTGMTAALDIAAQGFPVHLVEKSDKLGGNANNFNHDESGVSTVKFLKDLIAKVEANKLITVHLNAEVKDIPGYVGNFKLQIGSEEFQVGAVILAVGAAAYSPKEYGYGKDQKVATALEVEKLIAEKKIKAKDVAFIQCIGSRNAETTYCSRVCCTTALRNAIAIKEADAKANVTIFHKDIRSYGFREELYRKASQLGVRFLRFPDETQPEYDGKSVKAFDNILGAEVSVPVDCLVLSTGIAPEREQKEELAKMLKIPISKDGFFFEAHQKLRPVDFATEGVYVAGLAHWPKHIDECIAQASGAASRALTVISKSELVSEGIIASVNDKYCDGCGVCEGCCEYSAIEIVEVEPGKLRSVVNAGLCKGCGCCVAACPSGAMEQKGFKNSQIQAEIDACLDEALGA